MCHIGHLAAKECSAKARKLSLTFPRGLPQSELCMHAEDAVFTDADLILINHFGDIAHADAFHSEIELWYLGMFKLM